MQVVWPALLHASGFRLMQQYRWKLSCQWLKVYRTNWSRTGRYPDEPLEETVSWYECRGATPEFVFTLGAERTIKDQQHILDRVGRWTRKHYPFHILRLDHSWVDTQRQLGPYDSVSHTTANQTNADTLLLQVFENPYELEQYERHRVNEQRVQFLEQRLNLLEQRLNAARIQF